MADTSHPTLAAQNDQVSHYATELNASWPAITAARSRSLAERKRVHDLVVKEPPSLDDDGYSLVIYGSLARLEATEGSDVDWVLLVDDQARPEHASAAQTIERRLEKGNFVHPSKAGAFAALSFSHSLVHHIGGDRDSNQNLTQRILLLLESAAIGSDNAYNRVIRQVLNRYLFEDVPYRGSQNPHLIPRFLLNDVVRYWRTIAVDYANKRHAQREGWALRNAKLRMSRKLLFAAGLLMGVEGELQLDHQVAVDLHSAQPQKARAEFIEHLLWFVRATPLDILARACRRYAKRETGAEIFGAYDRFLALLAKEENRERLKKLDYEKAQTDALFDDVRAIGHDFQAGLNKLFFADHEKMSKLIMEYGVF